MINVSGFFQLNRAIVTFQSTPDLTYQAPVSGFFSSTEQQSHFDLLLTLRIMHQCHFGINSSYEQFCYMTRSNNFILFLLRQVQFWPVTTSNNQRGSNPVHGEVYLIQHYVMKFVSDLRQVGSFLRVLRFPPPIELTSTI